MQNHPYQHNAERYRASLQQANRQFNLLATARLLLFVLGTALSFYLFQWQYEWGVGLFAVVSVAFLMLLRYHNSLKMRASYLARLLEINEHELKAMSRDFSVFDGGDEFLEANHPYEYDLDIFGRGSIFQMMNRSATQIGKARLGAWLKSPLLSKAEILRRQKAVEELGVMITWRQHFQASGQRKLNQTNILESLQTWLDEPTHFANKPFYRIALILFPLMLIGLFVGSLFLVVPFRWFVLGFILHLAWVATQIGKVSRQHALLSRRYAELNTYTELLKSIEEESFETELLEEIQAKVVGSSEQLAALARLTEAFDNRLNSFAAILLNGLILWDFQCMYRLEKWKEQFQGQLDDWFDAVAQMDALVSMATFHYNQSDYVFPQILDDEAGFEAHSLGHPLLNPENRIDNDYASLRDDRFAVITGANMAGKSTFIRSVGVNLVLAMVGLPVCAKKLKLSPVKVFTSMRTNDSIQDSESYFYAELKRLKQIVDALEAGESLFVIVDEMLRGTNSHDKQKGAKGFLEKLLRFDARGMIATHDLGVGDLAKKYPQNIKNRCFEVEIGEEQLHFDYKLKEGIAQNMNASFLMEKMGIMDA